MQTIGNHIRHRHSNRHRLHRCRRHWWMMRRCSSCVCRLQQVRLFTYMLFPRQKSEVCRCHSNLRNMNYARVHIHTPTHWWWEVYVVDTYWGKSNLKRRQRKNYNTKCVCLSTTGGNCLIQISNWDWGSSSSTITPIDKSHIQRLVFSHLPVLGNCSIDCTHTLVCHRLSSDATKFVCLLFSSEICCSRAALPCTYRIHVRWLWRKWHMQRMPEWLSFAIRWALQREIFFIFAIYYHHLFLL